MNKEEYEIEQLKKEIPEFKKQIEITRKKFPNKAVLIEENRKTLKRIEEQNKKAGKITEKDINELEYRIKHEVNFLKGRSWLWEKIKSELKKK
jgi:hypothetical protein